MVAKKDPKYTPLKDGDILSYETAFLQASSALDIVATWAVESKDTAALATVAQQYIELGSRMMGPQQEEELEEHDLTSEGDFGFVPDDVAAAREVANGRTNRAATGTPRRRVTRIHKEHG